MWTRQRKRRNTGRLIVPVMATAFLGYFGYHANNGEYGLYSKYRLEQRAHELEARLAETVKRREQLEAKTMLLHDGSIEKDMLDEQARTALGLAREDEVVILTQPEKRIN